MQLLINITVLFSNGNYSLSCNPLSHLSIMYPLSWDRSGNSAKQALLIASVFISSSLFLLHFPWKCETKNSSSLNIFVASHPARVFLDRHPTTADRNTSGIRWKGEAGLIV